MGDAANKPSQVQPPNGDGGHYIMRRQSDKKERAHEQPVSTVTFYRGDPPVETLRARVASVVAENPWLAGQYRKHPDTGEFSALWVLKKPDAGQCFDTASNPAVRHGIPFSEMERCMTPLLVNKGKAGRPKAPNPLFKVVVVTGQGDSFCVVVSMCHTLGDGHTYTFRKFRASLKALLSSNHLSISCSGEKFMKRFISIS